MANDTQSKEYWERIESLRQSRKLSYVEIAKATGMQASYIYSCRSRSVVFSFLTTVKLAEVLGTTAEYLIPGSGVVDKNELTQKEVSIMDRIGSDKLFKLVVYKLFDFNDKELAKISRSIDEIILKR